MCRERKSKMVINLKQNEAQSVRAESTHKGGNQRSKYVTQVQQQRPESPMVTLTWHACKYKVHKLHPTRGTSSCDIMPVRVTVGDSCLCFCTCVTYFDLQ